MARETGIDLGRMLRAYGRKVYDHHRSHWMTLPLDANLIVPPPPFDSRLVFDASNQVLDFIRSLGLAGTCDPIEIRSMLARGHLFVGLQADRRWIGFAKLGWETVYVLDYGIDLVLPPGAFFVLESYILPAWRNRGAGRYLIAGTSEVMCSRGFTHRVSHVRTNNRPMLLAARHVGYRSLGTVEFLSVLGRTRMHPHPATLLGALAENGSRPHPIPNVRDPRERSVSAADS